MKSKTKQSRSKNRFSIRFVINFSGSRRYIGRTKHQCSIFLAHHLTCYTLSKWLRIFSAVNNNRDSESGMARFSIVQKNLISLAVSLEVIHDC